MSRSLRRIEPSIDLSIHEIPEGKLRIRILGHIVAASGNSLVINDGTGHITIALGSNLISNYTVGDLHRFLIEVNKVSDEINGLLITSHRISKDQAQQYKRLTKLERRIPK